MHMKALLVLALPFLATAAPAPAQIDDRTFGTPFFYQGHDLSSLKTVEDEGTIFKDTTKNNETRTADAILADGGMNTVRLRIWVNPEDGKNGLDYNLDLAKRFQKAGHKLYLDFHFSDSWADPHHQPIPAAWPTALEPLSRTLRSYVKDTLVSFKEAGINLDIIALGNEVRHGMLWPTGYTDVDIQPFSALARNFSSMATLYKAARAGVTDAVSAGVKKPQVMIHIDNGWNLTLQQRWFGALVANAVPLTAWDVFGFSFYPFYGTDATFANLKKTLNTLALTFFKPLQVVETDYPAICTGTWNPIPDSSEPSIPYDVDGQLTWTRQVVKIVREVPLGLGQGVHYWEPAWVGSTSLGSACEDNILFESDYSAWPGPAVGYSRASVDVFN